MTRKNFKLTIEYDGTDYCGWQRQPNGCSIQQRIESAVGIMTGQRTALIGSGRTDAGVHALAQVANFHCETTITPEAFQRGLNSLLPPDIVIRACHEVDESFHARFDAKSKTYRYTIRNHPLPAALGRQYEWWIKAPLDMEKMKTAAACFIGEMDFKSFEGAGSPRSHTIRHVAEAKIAPDPKRRLLFEITAEGFLRHMVRNIMGTLVAIGRGALQPDDIPAILASCDRSRAAATAPAQGLCLVRVHY